MNIALFGYGKMGKEIEQIALQRNHTIGLIVTQQNANTINSLSLKDIDVAIECSTPHTAVQNIKTCLTATIPTIVGTTGWYEHYDEVKELCIKQNTALLCATNFSIGVNLFFEMNRRMALLMKDHKEYDVSMQEIHHVHKKDAPSGTAISAAQDIIDILPSKDKWKLSNEVSTKKELAIEAIRTDDVPGTHSVTYKSTVDQIELKHIAHNRKGFALGAIIASEWIATKKGVFTMRDVLGI